MNPAYLMILVMVGVALGYFGSLVVRAISSENAPSGKGALFLSKVSEDSRLKVMWDGKVVATAADLTEAQRKQVQTLALDLNNWLGIPVSVTTPRLADIAPEPLPFELPAPILFTPSANSQPTEKPSSIPAPVSLSRTIAPTHPPEKPLKFSLNPVSALQAVIDDKSKVPPPSQSIIAQVDAILQAKVIGTPFEKSGIRLLEKPDHTMLIEVGLNKYDGIDTIPSEDIRNLIRTCVNEWTALSTRIG